MPATLRRGSTGPDVVRWQNILRGFPFGAKVVADGKFGPISEGATRDYQSAHKLVADGVVGPATWGHALGTADGTLPGGDVAAHMAKEGVSAAPPKSTPSNLNRDARAYEIARASALNLTEAERQYALAVARGEGGYGAAWANPSPRVVELSKKFGLTGLEGAGSNNWGAEQGAGDAGSFKHVDHDAKGKPYVGTYRRYSTPERGFDGFARILYSGNKRGAEGAKALRDAIARGSLRDAVFAQHANGYFELAPEKYLQAVLRNYAALSQNTGWTALLTERGGALAGAAGGALGVGVAALVGLGAFLWWKVRG